ncbi:uncharacterized protein MEPE_00495 [Melanopsichium pennsylvanicum]|uniref:DUF4203 domain-containing protein n=2 Tax=Melanopsichium pennsylvanicum TaxID=63383 RepID=A0AAJ4XGT1_9BASI|nr:hypothetical protein BN887_02447 [Melanopsichium pennsylvanicum 4]SNX81790.1 uncharacterized protein MEPE_00495 [Melanopsichium pennsylvanicum]
MAPRLPSRTLFLRFTVRDSDPGPVFSIANVVHDQNWMSILLCIVWIISGLFLLFFGWASFFWGCNLGNSAQRIEDKVNGRSRLGPLFAGAPIAGGVGGIAVGFLFFSFLAIVTASAICVAEAKSISSTSFFIIWLLPGLLGAFLAGHWALFARAFTGLLSGACFTVIVTAMFGIHTLIIRAILISICTSLVTAPLLIPKHNAIHFHLLNICTSAIGMVTFLDGVALFAPPRASSNTWIDLWALLFAGDNSPSELSATKKWGTSAFKGFIAAAVLGSLVGFLFEFIFHKHAAEDPDMEWNSYLGSFTQRLENHETADPHERAGAFEPALSAWQMFSRAFAESISSAAYGNITSLFHDPEKSPLTDLPHAQSRRKACPTRNVKTHGPARFRALSKGDKDLELAGSDSDTDYDSDTSLQKLNPRSSKAVSAKSLLCKAVAHELADVLKPLSAREDSRFDNFGAARIPRPPSYRTNSSNSGNGSTGNGVSRTMAVPPNKASRWKISGGPAEKAMGVYRDGDASTSLTRLSVSRHTTMSPPPPFSDSQPSSPLNPSFPATPSLVNAITRIQAAQAQARAWYETREKQDSSSPNSASSQVKAEEVPAKSSIQSTAKEASASRAVSPSAQPNGAAFPRWWEKEVKGGTKPLA